MNFIKKIPAQDTYTVRKEVLRKNIDLPYKLKGDLNEDTFHLGAFKKNVLVGVVSFMKFETPELEGSQYQLRGMATLPQVRGEGYGNLLIKEGVLLLKEQGIGIVWCNAREVALGFYRKNDFEVIGASFDIVKVGIHYRMKRELTIFKENKN